MRISLKNFRCYGDKTIEIPDQGLVSISGPSGSGKTTILSAIVFAFYGKIPGKARKPYTIGKKGTASVNVSYLELDITRTARPNRLIVVKDEVEYEDDAAQSIINNTLNMDYEEFMAGAYIIQRNNFSVLSMTPSEQLKFVEVLSQSEKVEDYKTSIKGFVKEKNTKKMQLQGSKTALQNQIDEKTEILGDEPDTPQAIEEGYDSNDLKEEICNIQTQVSKVNKLLSAKQKELDEIRSKEKNNQDIRNKINKLTTEIEIHTKRLNELQKEGFENVDDLEELKEKLENTKRFDDFQKLSENFKIAEQEHISHQKKQKKELEIQISELIGNFPTLEDMETAFREEENMQKQYDEKKRIYDDQMKIKESGRKELTLLFKKIRKDHPSIPLVKTGTAMINELRHIGIIPLTCPLCSSNVSLDPTTKTLIAEDNSDSSIPFCDVSHLISDIQEASKKLNITIKSPETPPTITDLGKRMMKINRLTETSQNLDCKLPLVLLKMKAQVDDLTKEFENFERGNVEELCASIENTEHILRLVLQNQQEQERITKEIETKKKSLQKLSPSLVSKIENKIKALEKEIGKYTHKIMDLTSAISDNREILDSMSEYLLYQDKKQEIENLQKNINGMDSKLEALDCEIEGFMGLEETVKEAELIALEEIVKSINEHARIYLDQMFEDPIDVRLECVKEVKSRKTFKLQMNTVIDYKGERYSDIEELSGGERQRCDMAFLLAISDMLGSGILLLDECLNNLDSEINTDVLNLVRDFCGGHKLIIVISHEAVKRIFDNEIQI